MFTRIRPTVLVCLTTVLLASCRGQSGTEPNSAITFTPHEVALLLGLNENSGVTFGEITSDKGGVKVASIRWGDKTGRQLDVRDVDLVIASTERLVYAISSLTITELDLLDLKTGQRAQLSKLTVAQPGEKFLAAFEDAIATAESGGVLKTSGLTFASLAVDKLDYLVRKDKGVSKVTLQGLAIDDANSDTLGTFAIERITAGEIGTLENLQLTKVDRQWTDDVVNALLSLAPYRPSLPPPAVAPGQAIIPFEQLTVDRLNLHQHGHVKSILELADLKIAVERDERGAMQALTASAGVAVAPDLLRGDPLDILRDYLAGTSSDALRFSVRVHARHFSDSNVEILDKLELVAPGVGAIKGRMQTQDLAVFLNVILYNAEPAKLPDPMISHLHVEYQDAGLIAYLLSNRYPQGKEANEFFTNIAENFPIESERKRLRREIERFRRSPGSIILDAAANIFLTFKFFGSSEAVETGALRVTLEFAER